MGRLRAELAHSQAGYQTMLRALHRKVNLSSAFSLLGALRRWYGPEDKGNSSEASLLQGKLLRCNGCRGAGARAACALCRRMTALVLTWQQLL